MDKYALQISHKIKMQLQTQYINRFSSNSQPNRPTGSPGLPLKLFDGQTIGAIDRLQRNIVLKEIEGDRLFVFFKKDDAVKFRLVNRQRWFE